MFVLLDYEIKGIIKNLNINVVFFFNMLCLRLFFILIFVNFIIGYERIFVEEYVLI